MIVMKTFKRGGAIVAEKELRKQAQKEERVAAKTEKKLVTKAMRKRRDGLLFVILLSPAIFFFCVFVIYPVLYNVYLSFLEWNMVSPNKKFVGIKNYKKLFADGEFMQSLATTFKYIGLCLITIFAFPYFLSYAMVHLVDKGQETYRSVLFFPSLISLSVGAVVFSFMFRFIGGPINAMLAWFDVEALNWLNFGPTAIIVIALVATWKTFGYNMLIFLGAILEVPTELIEAAKLENASKWKIFWRIVLPLTSSTAFYAFVITFTYGLGQVFTPTNILTNGGPTNSTSNLVYTIYEAAFFTFQSGRAAATALVTLAIVMVVVVLYQALEKKVHYAN